MGLLRSRKQLIWVTGTFVILSWLGFRQAGRIDADEEVAFFSPYLYWENQSTLRVVLRGRVYEPELDSRMRRAAVARVLEPALFQYIGKRPDEFDAAARERMVRLLHPFLNDGESRVPLEVRLRGAGGESKLRLPRTGAGGYFAAHVTEAGGRRLRELAGSGATLSVEAIVPPRDPRRFVAELAVPPPQMPLLVVSDVDDTVRIAEVTNRPRMIERVFLHEYEPVPGMAEIYGELSSRGAAVHFVSGSPWQVAPEIEAMLRGAKFPAAALHCRQIGWDFWNSDSLHTLDFKVAEISGLLDQFRSCPVLLIGDSGEHDPEVYTEIVRRYADRVAGVWIRRVGPPWDPARLAEVATRIGLDRAIAFTDSGELQKPLDAIPLGR
jgi:hypothetical protein